MVDQSLLIDEKRLFGKRLFALMGERQWTQITLASHAGVSRSSIHAYLTAARLPSAQAIVKLASVLGVTPEALADGVTRADVTAKFDPSPRHRFGERLAKFIAERGWNQSDLGRKAGIGRNLISSYARGHCLPTPRMAFKLARALKIDPQELLMHCDRPSVQKTAPHPEVTLPSQFNVTISSVDPDMAWVHINKSFPISIAMAIAKLVGDFYASNSRRSEGATPVLPKPNTEPAAPGFAGVPA